MATDKETFESVARRLDGAPVKLTLTGRKLAEDIQADEAFLTPRLEMTPPPGALLRAGARLSMEFAGRRSPRRHAVWSIIGTAVAASLAAALLLAALAYNSNPNNYPATTLTDDEALSAYLHNPASELDPELSLLDEQLAVLQADLTEPWDSEVDLELESVSHDVTNFWLVPLLPDGMPEVEEL